MITYKEKGVSMTRIGFLMFFAALIPLKCVAEDGDDCLYNQDAFIEMYAPLKAKYKNTKFIKKDKSLDIKFDDSKANVRYYGCEHYGTEINYFENKVKVYSDKELFEKTIDLIKRFGQDRIEVKTLRALLEGGKYEKSNGMYMVNYPDMDEFTITVSAKQGTPVVSISFYN